MFALLLSLPGIGIARTVVVGASASIPAPYIEKSADTGLAVDLIREALAVEGHRVRMKYLAGKGLDNNFKLHQVDALIMHGDYDTVQAMGITAYRSKEVYRLDDYAITLKGLPAPPLSIEDLGRYRVVAFFPASKVLGEAYAKAVSQSPAYKEIPVQTSQVLALYRGLADVAIADRRIFEYLQQVVRDSSGEVHDLTYHFAFPPAIQHLFFHDPALRDSYDRGLEQLKKSGRYQQLLHRYDIADIGARP